MSLEENKAIIRKFETEAINKHNPDMLDELMAPDYVDHPLNCEVWKVSNKPIIDFTRAFPIGMRLLRI